MFGQTDEKSTYGTGSPRLNAKKMKPTQIRKYTRTHKKTHTRHRSLAQLADSQVANNIYTFDTGAANLGHWNTQAQNKNEAHTNKKIYTHTQKTHTSIRRSFGTILF